MSGIRNMFIIKLLPNVTGIYRNYTLYMSKYHHKMFYFRKPNVISRYSNIIKQQKIQKVNAHKCKKMQHKEKGTYNYPPS